MKLYHHPMSPNCRKVLATAMHLGTDFEGHAINFKDGDLSKPEFLALNPNGKVPLLVDGDVTLWESNAIMAYLAGKTDTDLWPRTDARYDIMRWFNWEAAHWQAQGIAPVASERVFKPMMGGGPPDTARVEAGTEAFRRLATVLDGHLVGRAYLVGDTLTLADFAIGAGWTLAGAAQLPVADYPNIVRWGNALNEIPAWRETAPKMG